MNQPLIQRERVDEWLKRGTRASAALRVPSTWPSIAASEKSAEPACASTSMVRESTSMAAALSMPSARFAAT